MSDNGSERADSAQPGYDKDPSKHREVTSRHSKNGHHLEKLENENLQHQQPITRQQYVQARPDHQLNPGNFGSLRQQHKQMDSTHRDGMKESQTHDTRRIMRENRREQAEEEATARNIQSLVIENEALKKRVKANEAYMDDLLQNAMKDGRWNPLPDDTLRDRLNLLHSETKRWAKQWCRDQLTFEHLSKDQSEGCLRYFSRFVRCKSDGSLHVAITSPSAKMKGKITQMLLTGAVANLLATDIFSKPFFCMEQTKAVSMQGIYDYLQQANFQQAQIWRSTAWRILNPPQNANMSDHDKQVAADTFKRNQEMCEKIKTEFFTGPAGILLRQASVVEEIEQAESLLNILITATEIATLIWTQRSYLACVGMASFIEQKMAFSTASPLMLGHPFNRIDPEDPAHDGRDIIIVTQPAILAYDDDDEMGTKGNRYRVLAKAIVWLDDTKKGGLFRRDTG